MNFKEAFIDELEKIAANLAAGERHSPQALESVRDREAVRRRGRELSRELAMRKSWQGPLKWPDSFNLERRIEGLRRERAATRPQVPTKHNPKPSVWSGMDIPMSRKERSGPKLPSESTKPPSRRKERWNEIRGKMKNW